MWSMSKRSQTTALVLALKLLTDDRVLAYWRVIAAARSSGMAIASRVRRMSALSARIEPDQQARGIDIDAVQPPPHG
jgi:hypothetical protein